MMSRGKVAAAISGDVALAAVVDLLTPGEENEDKVRFGVLQRDIAPGQATVFCDADIVRGGGLFV